MDRAQPGVTTVSRCYEQTDQQKDKCHDPATVVRATRRAEEAGCMGLKLSDVENERRDEAKVRNGMNWSRT